MSFREFLIQRLDYFRTLKRIYDKHCKKWTELQEQYNGICQLGAKRRCWRNHLIAEHKSSECFQKVYELQNWLSRKRKKENVCKTK